MNGDFDTSGNGRHHLGGHDASAGSPAPQPALEPGGLYRLGANESSTSIFEDVEMAHDEVCRPIPRPNAALSEPHC